MFLQFILFYCLMQHVLPMEVEVNNECKFAEDSLERTSANDLHFFKGLCDEAYEECYNAAEDELKREACSYPRNNCVNGLIGHYETIIEESEYASKLFKDALSGITDDCYGLCKYDLVFKKLVDEHVFCE
ncbi:hypothetical protein FF38_13531 [Lucilia cuprina]|uniref:Protein TsetseEP domain-containing protein n=1 Tax=Lucilia cuprina TaxID=7375 RepID=A0A0L0BQ06_LUCCU|nr:hypothetical protein CVS40_7923 [Lucilia cuprina]KNC22091.1 hypothetical protein FF38_13531 [Lucilia cuprina]